MNARLSIARIGLAVAVALTAANNLHAAEGATFIVQAPSLQAARQALAQVGARGEADLPIIRSVSAQLDADQVASLKARGFVLYADRPLRAAGLSSFRTTLNQTNSTVASSSTFAFLSSLATPVITTTLKSPLLTPLTSAMVRSQSQSTSLQDGRGVSASTLTYETNYPALIGADVLQQSGITGKGVTIAVLDTGLWNDIGQNYGKRLLASIDVTNGGTGPVRDDPYGHGTHITSIAASGAFNLTGQRLGIAPDANLVVVRAFNGEGAGRYADVIRGVNWIVANKAKYNIRVLNLSFGAEPQSNYWDDPLNQAVMAAWQAGITVVASAGNSGPLPMSIDVPGNVPYVITVGALTDNGTPYDGSDDRLASFSGAGPTYEGFVKPEIVAPGGHIAASMSSSSYLANLDPDSMRPGQQLFTMSGTSQAAAVTTGVVALMLQADPALTPDAIKCRLMAAARPALKVDRTLAYSVFQQGAGLVNAVDAVHSSATGCANGGLDLAADIAGKAHFGGPANQDDSGNYFVMDMDGSAWGGAVAADGFTWSRGYPWSEGYSWSSGYTWSRGFTWSRGYTWSRSMTAPNGFTLEPRLYVEPLVALVG